MAEAIRLAKASLPEFWKVFEQPTRGETGFALKVRIQDEAGEEYFWLTDIARRGQGIFGVVDGTPRIVKRVREGQRIEIPEPDISDWLYLRDGRMVGNRTIVPLFKTMTTEEADRFRAMMEGR